MYLVRNSLQEGAMLADPTGLGKTLPAMMVVAESMYKGRFSIVVVTASSLLQWESEFERFFRPKTVKVLVLKDPTLSAEELLKYDVILTSYQFVTRQYARREAFITKVRQAQTETVFSGTTKKGRATFPIGVGFSRLAQLLASFMIRRPLSTISLPLVYESESKFLLTEEEARKSNSHYESYQHILRMKKKKAPEYKNTYPLAELMQASQEACHPSLVKIMSLIRPSFADEGDASYDVIKDVGKIEAWKKWKESMSINDRWRSSRIDELINTFNFRRDQDPGCSTLIIDESVYFLDIVQIAFENMDEPVKVLRFDGRVDRDSRRKTLDDFQRDGGVLLVSRGSGGITMNMTRADTIFICCPLWKRCLETEAIGGAHRHGQNKPVYVFRLVGENCKMDQHRAKRRKNKDKNNTKFMDILNRSDGTQPPVFDQLRASGE
ncbi:hypothetical protein HYFRA_00011002 [Hymenoscyphus fraxineus]|uniref:Helicase ATP-binding domain-containing protein n=1 Tax=Hymenoscyphus fraxineus TaxID=746836 RepID=A0A9N9KXH7_9HELO|nr:hypothetical protein HYFRA_00011002 [Hymenoscyphus fraxineus]